MTGYSYFSSSDEDDVGFGRLSLLERNAGVTCYSQRFGNEESNTYDPDNIEGDWNYLASSPNFWSRHSSSVRSSTSVPSKPSKHKKRGRGTAASSKSLYKGKQSISTRSAMQTKAHEYEVLRKWLKARSLEEHLPKFKKDKITLKELKLLTDEELKGLGLPLGSRKLILEALKQGANEKEPPNEFLCPITAEMMKDPVIAQDGFSYERSAINQWFKDHDKSPMTNETLSSKSLTPNRQLKKLIDDFREGVLLLKQGTK